MERKRKRKKILKKLKKPFRLIILNENTFEERLSYSLTPMNVIVMVGGFLVVFSFIFYSLIAFTPLRTVLIPDFSSYESRENARIARLKADSLTHVLASQDKYYNDLKIILSGGTPISNVPDSLPKNNQPIDLNYQVSELDMSVREDLARQQNNQPVRSKIPEAGYLLFRPVAGTISNPFNLASGQGGVTWAAQRNEPVMAVLQGTILSSTFSVTNGNTVTVQHPNGFVSIYKSLGVLLKQAGQPVKAGESIGWVGESANFQFELWKNGVQIDPGMYFTK